MSTSQQDTTDAHLLARHAAGSEAVLAACQEWHALAAQASATLAHRRASATALCERILRQALFEDTCLIPWLARVLGEQDDALQALESELGALRDLAAEVLATSPRATLHDARVRVLCRYAQQHLCHRHEAWWPGQGVSGSAAGATSFP